VVQQRPTSLLLFGILHITFGVIWIFIGLCTVYMLLSSFQDKLLLEQNPSEMNKEQLELLDLQLRTVSTLGSTPLFAINILVWQTCSIAISMLLIVAGIGLIRVKPWARRLSIACAIVSILSTVWVYFCDLAFTFPPLIAFFDQERAYGSPGVKSIVDLCLCATYGALVLNLVYFIYPVIVLIWMTKASTVGAFGTRAVAGCQRAGVRPGNDVR
jgi:hypothetical protein